MLRLIRPEAAPPNVWAHQRSSMHIFYSTMTSAPHSITYSTEPGGWPGQSRSFNSRGCPVQAPLGRGSPPLNEDVVVTHLFLAPGSNSGTAPPFVHFLLEPGPSMMIILNCRYYL